jgi:hypothetical protein
MRLTVNRYTGRFNVLPIKRTGHSNVSSSLIKSKCIKSFCIIHVQGLEKSQLSLQVKFMQHTSLVQNHIKKDCSFSASCIIGHKIQNHRCII